MANYFRTFTDLKNDHANFLEFKNYLTTKIPSVESIVSTDDTLKFYNRVLATIWGATFFGITSDDAITRFRSNRYFSDALNIDVLPSSCEIEEFYHALHKLGINRSELISYISNHQSSNDRFESEAFIDYEFLDKNGYLIIPNVLDHGLCDELNRLTASIANYEKDTIKKGYVYGSGNMQRVYSLISKDKIFQDILENKYVECIMKHMFQRDTFHDKYYLTSFHANLLNPNSENQIWHIDANVPDPIPPWIIRSNSNYITQDYSSDCGATEIIPGSHVWNRKPTSLEAESGIADLKTIHIEAPKGSLAFWHGHLWHRSGKNTSNRTRIALLGAYAASYVREVSMEENPYLNLDLNQVQMLSDKTKSILGWNHGAKFYY